MKILTLLFAALIIAACKPLAMGEQAAIDRCVALCERAVKDDVVLDSQCLGNLNSVWVCDVSHHPKEPQDNYRENKCKDYADATHKRFVEVYPNCTFLRIGSD